jgi:mannan endo-1,6-alpha-mannosidase
MNLFLLSLSLLPLGRALNLTNSSDDSVCDTASIIAKGALNYYSETAGEFSGVHWWLSGVAIGSLLNYQKICSDDQFEDVIHESLLAQCGDNYDYQPDSLKSSIGNDDIGTWGLSVVAAAENNFTSPGEGEPSWLNRSENVFDLLYGRWDESVCGGGLRWQFNSDSSGYDYKALISNANLFQLAARLAKLTKNDRYTKAAEEIYDWISDSGLVNDLQWGSEVYDGFNVDNNCSDIEKVLWSYNYGTLIAGAGYLYQVTGDDKWETRASNIILGSQILYNDTILYERACATYDTCNSDQRIFKGVYLRFVGMVKKLVPSLKEKVEDLITPSGKAAARSCSGGSDNVTCGQDWTYDKNGVYWDGKYSLQEQISALEAVLAVK